MMEEWIVVLQTARFVLGMLCILLACVCSIAVAEHLGRSRENVVPDGDTVKNKGISPASAVAGLVSAVTGFVYLFHM